MIRDDVCGVPWSHIESAQGMYTQAHHRSPLTAQGWCLEFERDVCLISGNSTSGPAFYVALVITTKALGLTSNEYADAKTVVSVAVDLLTRREMAQAQRTDVSFWSITTGLTNLTLIAPSVTGT
jgi:hypothetical protein